MSSWEERKRAVNHAIMVIGKGGEVRLTETTDRLFVKVTVADNKGKEMSCFLPKQQYEALLDCRYELTVLTPEEAVVEKMANGAEPKEEAEDA